MLKQTYHKLRATVKKPLYTFGKRPPVVPAKLPGKYIPDGYKAVLMISADFELAWAWRFSRIENPIQRAHKKAALAWANMSIIMELCDKYDIPVIWATVGHLFLKECSPVNGILHPEIKRLNHFENLRWVFNSGDWYRDDPGTDFKCDPHWYCPDLIKQLIESKTKHEIACHTFSHIDCSDKLCPSDVFLSEITACKKEAEKLGLAMESFVHPAHTIGNLKNLADSGFTNFRTDKDILSYPIHHPEGIWELQSSQQMVWNPYWSGRNHVQVYNSIVSKALRTGTVCNLWFHPSMAEAFATEVLPGLFKHIESMRDKLWVGTSKEYCRWLNQEHGLIK
ncbi:MAG: polysaccharide deacetylase [Candidatus Cloacimonetes bacterium]|nr:polysaccharide deacetylase [Candidatus Cloacimonadota bacterium]